MGSVCESKRSKRKDKGKDDKNNNKKIGKNETEYNLIDLEGIRLINFEKYCIQNIKNCVKCQQAIPKDEFEEHLANHLSRMQSKEITNEEKKKENNIDDVAKSNDEPHDEWIKDIQQNDKIDKYEQSENPPYDLVIDIKSIYELNKGWKIYSFGNDKNVSRTKNYDHKKKYIISVIGNANRGKTFLLRLLSNFKELDEVSKDSITTLGLSIKIPQESNFILLDTVGFNAPLLIENINQQKKDIRESSEDKFNKILNTITRGQIITNYLLQNFIINEADIIICLIAQLNYSEQIFLNQIRAQCEGKKTLYVVHNLIHLQNQEEIEKYINEILLKSYTFNLEKINIPKFGNDNSFNYYFREKSLTNNEKNNKEVLHFILGNEKHTELKYYNTTTIDYLKDIIDTNCSSSHQNILNSLKDYIQKSSAEIFKTQLDSIKLSNTEIKCEIKKLETKDIAINELEKITFIEEKFKPQYRYYVMGENLYIEIVICSKADITDRQFNYKEESVEFVIKGKKIKNETYSSNAKILVDRRKYGDFEIKFTMYLDVYNIKAIIKDEKIYIDKGIITIKYPIEPSNKIAYDKTKEQTTQNDLLK